MSLPAFPRPLARFIGRLPTLPASLALSSLLNLGTWKALRNLDWQGLRGRRFCVFVKDTGVRAYFSVGAKGFMPEVTPTADVTFTATAEDFLKLALRLEDPDTLFFNRRLRIEGDTDLGLTVKNMLDAVELETITAAMPLGLGGLVPRLRHQAMRHADMP